MHDLAKSVRFHTLFCSQFSGKLTYRLFKQMIESYLLRYTLNSSPFFYIYKKQTNIFVSYESFFQT